MPDDYFETVIRGPVMTGEAHGILRDIVSEAAEQVADEGARDVKNVLHSVIRHPTGRYENSIHAVRRGIDATVSDDGIIYGPWLEGTGSRNKTTRFKGYATFRKVTQALQGKAATIVDGVIRASIDRLGGGR